MKYFSISWLDNDILDQLFNLKSCRITGSFGRGNPRNDSDLDIKMNEKDLKIFKQWLYQTGRNFDSELPGHITIDGVEIFVGFYKCPNKMDVVNINGKLFKTW